MRSTVCRVSAALLLSASCAIDPVRGADHGALFGHGRVEVDLGAGRNDHVPRPFTHALEVGVTGVRGINATNDFEVGIGRYRVVETTVAWKPTLRLGPTVSVSGLVGLAYDDLSVDLDTSLAGGAAPLGANGPTYGDTALGGMLGVEARVGLPVAGVYGRASQASDGRTTSGLFEVGLEFRPVPSLWLQVAYRWWNLEANDLSGAPPQFDDIELTVDGLTVGGVVRF